MKLKGKALLSLLIVLTLTVQLFAGSAGAVCSAGIPLSDAGFLLPPRLAAERAVFAYGCAEM